MTTIYLVRHGQSVNNLQKKFTGHADADLSPDGYAQAERVADFLVSAGIQRIYSSDLMRAYNTALPTAKRLGLSIETTCELRELGMGRWENMSIEQIQKTYPEEYTAWLTGDTYLHAGGGESWAELFDRVYKELHRIAEENDEKTVLVAAHNGVLRSALLMVNGMTPDQRGEIPLIPNGGVLIFTYENGVFSFKEIQYLDPPDALDKPSTLIV